MDKAPLKGVLQLVHEGEIVDTIVLKKETTVFGRDEGDIVLEDTEVSSQHCQIQLIAGLYHLFDLNSTNGTFVNDTRVHKARLESGDRVRIGKITLIFSFMKQEQQAIRETLVVAAKDSEMLDSAALEILKWIALEKEKCAQELSLQLDVTYGDGQSEVLQVRERQFTLGRLSAQGSFDKDEELSRRHARISVTKEGGIEVEDLDSTNGTFVNEQQLVGKRLVTESDVVRIGSTRIKPSTVL